MGRLIDADKLIEKIWKLHEETEKQYDLCVDELKDIYCGVVSLIDTQPTAYDVDAVVKQLDEYITKIVGRKSALYQTVMQIMKGGGVDAKTDFIQRRDGAGDSGRKKKLYKAFGKIPSGKKTKVDRVC